MYLEENISNLDGLSISRWVEVLRTVKDGNLRNSLALRLTDVSKDVAIYNALVELIQREDTVGNRGTLLYCLDGFDCSSLFEKLVEFVINGGFEVSHEAFARLMDIEQICGEQVEIAKEQLKAAVKGDDIAEWRRALIQDALACFGGAVDDGP